MSQQRNMRERAQSEPVDATIRDPMEFFGTEIMLVILSNLDAQSLALSLLVSRQWNSVVSSDTLWASKYEGLKLLKAHIPRSSQLKGLTKLAAYSLSIMDGKRTRITKYDLCDHVWEFRFNKAAPQYWRDLDPYWLGQGPALVRKFEVDGSVIAEVGDKTWGGHESSYCIVTSFVGDGKIREHYVRINRWPGMSVQRNRDWSWNMANDICCYSSVPDPHKPGGTGPQLPAAYYMK